MPELGTKHQCFSCEAKFYDLGRPEAVCPKCGANQKDARKQESVAESQATRRKRRDEVVTVATDDSEASDAEPSSGSAEFGDDDLGSIGDDSGDDGGDDDDLDDD